MATGQRKVCVVAFPESDISEIRDWIRRAVMDDDMPECVKEILFAIWKDIRNG